MTKRKRGAAAEGHRGATAAPAPSGPLALFRSVAKPLALVVAISVLAYANTLRNGFTLDDVPIIVENPTIRSVGSIGTIFGSNYWSRGGVGIVGDSTLYRPLTVFTYAVDFALWDLNAAAYHLVNVVLHTATTVLVFLVAIELFGSVVAAFAAASLFGVHPIHTEAVASVVGRSEVLATLLVLTAFLVLRRRPTAGMLAPRTLSLGPAAAGGALYLLGLFAKESAVTLPLVLAVDDVLRRDDSARDSRTTRREVALRYGALVGAAAVYFSVRRQAVSGGAQMWPGFVGVSPVERALTASRVMLEYIGLFVYPKTLLADYWKPDVPIASSILDPLVALSVLAWIGLAVLAAFLVRRGRHSALVLSIAWFFITIVPVSNIFFPIGVGKAERLLYLPSVGLCLVAGWGYGMAAARLRSPRLAQAALATVLAALTVRTVLRNGDWRDNATLALATLAVSPSSPLMNDLAAGEYFRRGDAARAVELLREAARQAPDMALIRSHLGAAYHSQGKVDEAIAEYRESIRTNPTDASTYNNLGVAYRDKGREDEALAEFSRAIAINPNYADPHINIGSVQLERGRLTEAEAAFAAAVRADPLSANAHNALGVALGRLGHIERAAEQHREALRLQPDHASARANLERLSAPRTDSATRSRVP
jgi:Flp pilus assembly protein TadD